MSNHKGARKTLAVFMAVLMVMSCWVFTPISLKAEALSAGTYNVEIVYYITNEGSSMPNAYTGEAALNNKGKDSGDNNCAGFSLFFKRNNGTGTSGEIYWNIGQSSKTCGQVGTTKDATVQQPTGYVDDSTNTPYYARATIPGFPTALFAFLDYNSAWTKCQYSIREIKVGKPGGTLTTIWAGSIDLSSHIHADYGRLKSDYSWVDSVDATCSTTTKKWNSPKASSIVWDTDTTHWSSNNLKDATISTGSADVSRLAKFHVVDQYNVNMSTAALNSLNTAVGATVTSTNYPNLSSTKTTLTTTNTNNLYYTATDMNADYQVNVIAKSALKSTIKGLNERLVTVTAKAGTGVTSSKTFKIYDPKYRITFDGNGGSVSPTYYDVYYGESLKSQAALDSKSTYPVGGTRTGYTWLGMFDKADGGNLMNVEDDVTAAKKYFAHWDKNLYTVVFLNRKGEYVDVQYIYHGENADSATPASKLKKVEYDSAKHYTLNESAPWSPGVTNITANVITKAQYVAEEHDFDNGVSVAATCHSGAGTKYTCEICGYSYIKDESTDRAPHQFGDALTITKEPTCTATGIGYKTCTVCGEHSEDVTVPATGHSYKISKTDATCSKEGSITYTCTKGDDTHTEVLPKTQHNMVAGAKVAATCTSAAYTPYTCADCSYSYNVYDASQPAVGHNWGAWSVTTAATNTADGVMSRTCSKCNKTETVTIPKGGHTFPTTPTSETPATCHSTGTQTFKCTAHTNCGVSITVTTAKTAHNYKTTINNATCTSAGSVVSACQNSGCTEKITTTLPASGHNYETSAVTKEPTCTETGVRTYTCSKCNTTKTETIPASGHKTVTVEPTCTQNGKTVCAVCGYTTTTAKLGHSYGAWETVISATCKNQGVRKHVCTRTDCGHTEIETTPTTGHTWNADKTVDYDSTCSTLGQKSTHCSICGTIKDGSKETIAKKAHTMGTAQTVVEPTCTGKGVTKTVCSVCGYTETATVAALGHDYSVTVSNTPATCTEAGVKTLKCSRCEAKDTVVTQPTGHKFVAGTPVAASCKDAGHVTMTCDKCGDSYEKYTTPPTQNHNWEYNITVNHGKTVISGKCSVCGAIFSTSADSDHELTKVKSYTPATCKSEGTLVLECAVSGCTQTHTVTLAVNSNAHANVTVTETKATCTSDGSIVTKCADCGKTLSTTAVPKTGHAFNIQTAYTAPTCKSEGSVTYKCGACDETKTDTLAINPDAHKFTKGAHHNADCTHPAYDEYKCDYCGESYNSFSGSANGHTYTTTTSQSGTTLTITCKCSVCGDTHTQTVEVAEGHNYTDVTVDKEPTCTAEGTMTIACDGKHKAGCASVITVSVPKNSKAHNIETRYTAPDCKTGGSVITACTNGCGLTENRIDIAPLGHDWDEGEITKAADCENDGVMTYTCTRGCGKTKTEVIAKTGHNWDNGTAHDADCTHGKYTHFTCSNCNGTYDAVEDGAQALGHSWDNGTVTKQPTCTEDGVMTYGCTRNDCDVTRTEPIGKLGHNFEKGTEHPATCTSAAYTEYKCANNCGAAYNAVEDGAQALGHKWGDWETVTESTNTTAGLMRRTCKNDASHVEEITIPAGGHELVLKSETPATCTNEGKQTFECTKHDNCGVSIEVTTAKIAHTLETTVKAATCENAGSVTTKCTKCGEATTVTEIPALGHKYDDEHSVKHEADCTHSGYTTYTCVRNGCTNTINVFDKDATGHVWGKTAIESTATCTESGMATYKCENCNSTIEVEVAALGHDYSGEPIETVESTCNTIGHKTYKCSRCDSTHTEYSDKLGEHKFGAWQEVQTATDVLPGIKVRQCEVCGLYEYEYKEPTGKHVYEVTSKTEATCTTDGEIVYTCASEHCDCEDGNRATYTEVIPATGHNKILNVVDATCTAEGHARIECKTCGDVLENKTIGVKGHTYGETPDSVKAPTCSADGKIVYNCTVCGESKTVTVDKIPNAHNWVLESTQTATCTQAGYETYKCSVCGEIYKKFISDRTPHEVSKTITTPATCKDAGVTIEVCSCGQLMGTTVLSPDPNAHNWVEKTAPANGCLKSGYTYKECTVCGQIKDIVVNAADGHLYAQRTAKKATCDVGGEDEIYCKTCDKVVKTIETAPLGHDYGEGYLTEATCKIAGSVVFTCQRDASHKLTKEIPATGAHKYQKTEEVAATCKNSAYDLYVCADCGDSYKEITGDAAAHEYVLQPNSKAANCTEAGHYYFKCANCDAAYDYEIPAKGHTYTATVTQTASCQGAEITKYTCTDCGDSYEVITKVPTAHNWTEWTTTKAATENEAGEQERHCEVCNDKETAPIPATGSHVMEEDTAKYVPATCDTEGKRVYICKTHENCTADYTVTIAALGHQTSIDYKTADCKEAGHANLVCTREGCGKTLETKEIPQLKHSFSETSRTYPTCVDSGVINYKCDNCGETASTVLPATGAHKLSVLEKVEATCKTQGYTLYKCDDCDYTCMKDLTELAPHTPGEPETVSAPTCTAPGYVQTKCTECDTIISTEVTDPNGHSYTETVTKTVDNADGDTCLKAEYTYNKCACGAIDESSITVTAPKGHDWGEWTVVTPSTNKADGEMKRVCRNDESHVETATIPMGGHTFDTANPTSEKKATCYEKGEKIFECTAHRDAEGKNTCGVSITVETEMIQHTFEITRTEGNCTETGSFIVECIADGCGTTIETVLPAIGHEYGEGKITKTATCQQEGEVTFTCTRTGCGHTITKSTPTVPHDYIANGKPVAATCIKSGYQNYKCKNCDDNYDVIIGDATGHTYISDPNNADVAATCTTEGHVYKKCANCSAAYDYEIPAKGHTYTATVTQQGDCAKAEITTYTCSVCAEGTQGHSYTEITAAPTGEHKWTAWTVAKPATENEAGEQERHCEVCGLKETAPIPATGSHTLVEDKAQHVDATCEGEGKIVYVCTKHDNCTAGYTVTLAPLGHKAKLQHKDAECNVGGYSRVVCTREECGKVLDETTIAALKHSFVEIEGTRVAPKCNKDGSISYKCENCGEEKTVAIEAVTDAHKLVVDKTVESTCTEQGYTLYKCENDCGYECKDNLQPLAPHTAATHETVVEPTCEGIGTVRNICSCGAIVSVEEVPAKGHKYETKTAAGEGCLTSGYTYEECSVCGNIRNIKTSEAANHEYEQRVIAPATCTADGTVEIYCKNCDKAVKTITVSALGHNFGGTPTVDKSTCEHEGSVTYTCQRTDCDATLTQKLDKVPHNYQFVKAVAATCLNSGYDLFKCADCPAEYKNITSPATGHHYGDDPEHANVAASCFKDGHVYKKCADCDAAYDYAVPATGEHVYDSGTVVTPATCLDSEVTEYRCTADGCTASYREVTGKANGHIYTNWTYSHSAATGTCACGATITVENVPEEAGHNWVYSKITKPATCKNVGYIEFICGDGADCTATLTKAYGPIADAHVWDDGKVTKEPECETDGVKTYTCTECGETKTETVAKLGHEYNVLVERVEATCVADGHITYKCSRCESEKTELIAKNENNHSYKPVVTAPTCIDDGYVTMICELCGHEGEKTVNADTALGHDVEVITVAPTCKEAGSKITQCKRCHTVLKTEGIAPVDHTWDDGVITTEAKCEKDGVKTFTCSVCKTTKEETIARLGHDYSVTAETVDSTCVADGHTTYKCSRCDSTKTELIPKDADKHTLESVTVEATCLEDGYTVDRCKLCGYESEKTDIVKALGHDEETVIVNQTCTQAGSKTVRCKRCGTVISTEGIAPLGHDYIVTEIEKATCIDPGENKITCSRCDYIAIETVPAKGHKWDNGTVVTDGDCETKKVTRFTCTECGITKDVLSGDLGKHDYKFVKTVAPTCTDEGYDLYECSKCHKQQQTKFVEALGHDWGYWNIVKYPTETETGLQERYCQREGCGAREEQTIVYGKFYLVTFYNYDGTRLMPPAYYEYGAKALRPKTDPVKAADTSYTYEYIGWNYDDRQIDFVTERMAIIAQYKAHERYYTVTYKDEDGTVLAIVPNIPFSQIADRYPNSVPTKASDELNDYTFSSWAITANSNTGEAVAVATYKATEKKPGTQPAGKPGIFSKFIEWLKNLFKKLFGKG